MCEHLRMHRQVWVDLEALHGQQGKQAVDVRRPDVMDVSGMAPGELRQWLKRLDGSWWGLVDYRIMWTTLNPSEGLVLRGQLVPASVLSKREYGAARRK